jgi:Glycosyl transferase family 2
MPWVGAKAKGLVLDLAAGPGFCCDQSKPQPRQDAMKATVVASMRNEGPFIVEWVAWYRMLGFDRVLVVTNDCTDRSPALLQALQTAGWVQHLDVVVPQGSQIVAAKLKEARRHKAVTQADWVLVCDVDEFLVVHKGAGLLADLTGAGPPWAFLGMAIAWRVFGSGGRETFDDMPVHRQFLSALRANRPLSAFVKTLYRAPRWFRVMGEHGPRQFKPEKAEIGQGGNVWVTAAGRPVPSWQPDGDYLRYLPGDLVSHQGAQMNHYMLRSEETYSLKAGTLAPASGNPRYDDGYHRAANHGDVIDASALKYRAAFDALQAEAMALPGVRRLHHLCCADHLTAIAVKTGRAPEDDPRIARHLALAEAAE